MITQETLQFLLDLSQNNNKDWFEKNKKRYEYAMKKEFTPFVQAWITAVKTFDPAVNDLAKDSIFRIYRDTRFSNDKSPYKHYFSAVVSNGGKKSPDTPGYYLQLEGGCLMIGGGAYMLEKDKLFATREKIAAMPNDFMQIIENENFTSHFEALKGEKNVRIDPVFKDAAKAYPILLNKQFYVMASLDPSLIIQPNAIETVVTYCKAMKPLNDFLSETV
jgi:uncharacterized protein (TIGR02453 family)